MRPQFISPDTQSTDQLNLLPSSAPPLTRSLTRRDRLPRGTDAERYYAPFNERFFELLGNDAFEPYVSDSAYARGALAPSGLRYFFDGTDDNLALARACALELSAQWAGFVDAADELPAEAQEALARRDGLIRRVAADSSPDNANREKVFGASAFAKTKALLAGDLDAGDLGAS